MEFIPGTTIPKPTVVLVGTDGNAFAILGTVHRSLKKAGASAEVLEAFMAEATSGDYSTVLVTAMKYVDVE